nr:hypothetical protein [Planctomycetota bacterium]
DFGPLTPDPAASGLKERPEPMSAASPSELLDADDPFAETPAAPPASTPAAEGDDDPFGDKPTPASETAPAENAESEPAPTQPALDFGDPFGDEPVEAAPEESPTEPANTNAEPSFEPSPGPTPETALDVPAETGEPITSDDAFGADPFGADPFQSEATSPAPATSEPDSDFDEGESVPLQPAIDEELDREPSPTLETPADENESPRRLPEETDLRGIGTVSPDDPQGQQHAELTVEKKAPEKATLGQPLVYEIIVTNVGKSPAHEVTVSDVVPKGMELGGTSPRAEMAGKTLVWKLDTLEPGKSTTIKVKATPIEAGMLGSVATVNFVSEVAARTEVVAAHLTLKLNVPPQVAIGQPVDFRFEIGNDGNAPAEKVLLRNVLPDGFQHADGNDLEYEVGDLPPGKTEAVTLRVAAVKPGSFKNTAVLTATGGLKSEAVAAVNVSNRKVTVTRQGPKRRYVGRPAMYANTVKNASQESVSGVKVLEQVPPGLEFVQASHGGQFDADKRTVAWRIAAMRPGQEQTLQVVLTAAEEGVQDSVVRVEEAEGGGVEVASATAVTALPSLAPTLQTPEGPIVVGERTALQIRIKNRGNASATTVAVSLILPPQLKLVEARGGPVTSAPNGKHVIAFATPVSAGGEQMVEFIVEGVTAGPARIRAEVNAGHMAKPLVKDEQLVVTARR